MTNAIRVLAYGLVIQKEMCAPCKASSAHASGAGPSNASQLAVGRQQSLAAQRPCEMASPATQVTTGKQQAQAACQAEPLTANTIHLHSNQAQCVSALAGPMQQLMEAMQPSQRAEPAPAASAQTHHLTTGNQQKATQVVGSKLTRQQAQSETMQTAGSLVRKATAEEGRSESPAPAAGRDSPAEPAEKRQKLEGPSLPGGSGYKMQNKPHLVWQTGLEAGVRGAQDAQQVLQRKYTCWRDTIRPYLHPDGNVNLQLACWAKPNTNKRYNEEKDLFMEVVRRGAGSAEREQQVLAVMAGMKVRSALLLCARRSLSKAPMVMRSLMTVAAVAYFHLLIPLYLGLQAVFTACDCVTQAVLTNLVCRCPMQIWQVLSTHSARAITNTQEE